MMKDISWVAYGLDPNGRPTYWVDITYLVDQALNRQC